MKAEHSDLKNLVAVKLAVLDLTRFTWSHGHISNAGLSETAGCLEKKEIPFSKCAL